MRVQCARKMEEKEDDTEGIPCHAWRNAQLFDAISLDHKHRFTVTMRVLRETERKTDRERGEGRGSTPPSFEINDSR